MEEIVWQIMVLLIRYEKRGKKIKKRVVVSQT